MNDVLTSLRGVTVYPIPAGVLAECALDAGCNPDAEVTREVRNSKEFKRAKAHVYNFLASAPNITQQGVSFSFSATERANFRKLAATLEAEANGDGTGGVYGYVGEDF